MSALAGTALIPVVCEVTEIETVRVPAGTFDCFKVDLNIKQTFWYATNAPRYLVKFEAAGTSAKQEARVASRTVLFQPGALVWQSGLEQMARMSSPPGGPGQAS